MSPIPIMTLNDTNLLIKGKLFICNFNFMKLEKIQMLEKNKINLTMHEPVCQQNIGQDTDKFPFIGYKDVSQALFNPLL